MWDGDCSFVEEHVLTAACKQEVMEMRLTTADSNITL